jgi:branched-subunit amino acid aminotransferase/4-amino-4-deoxychorismate lyase
MKNFFLCLNVENFEVQSSFTPLSSMVYGESVFSTIRLIDSFPVFWNLHSQRLQQSIQWLWNIKLEESFFLKLAHNINLFSSKQFQTLRVVFFFNHQVNGEKVFSILFHLSEDLPKDESSQSLILHEVSQADIPVFYKRPLHSVFQKIISASPVPCHDLLLQLKDSVLETTRGNIFFHDGTQWLTPTHLSDYYQGVTREVVGKILGKNLKEKNITVLDLKHMQTAFTTSSLRGIVPIHKIENTIEFKDQSEINSIKNYFLEEQYQDVKKFRCTLS